MKRPYLVVYEYGQGAVWAYVTARSGSEVERQFPELKIVKEPPDWMSRSERSRLKRTMTFDIDQKEGLLRKILEQRDRHDRRHASDGPDATALGDRRGPPTASSFAVFASGSRKRVLRLRRRPSGTPLRSRQRPPRADSHVGLRRSPAWW